MVRIFALKGNGYEDCSCSAATVLSLHTTEAAAKEAQLRWKTYCDYYSYIDEMLLDDPNLWPWIK